ncbi:tautomerase family protein [Pseudomonas viridiflava]|uniref:tautomerase family protein n=1 Tax=Pseudomonas viridiflava TaxID=33069 RepID=UPI000F05916C|nr:tautomerase family protein [Pseudomonas viridiflava]MBD8200456.1 tautomerase family protein [Pseudomonas viridiflava]MDY0933882.1 tautomerase family protein [Pseudomonas viridiflava]MDY1010407.1 tautomerase family protein [Pseudomonas viridiflava]TKJ68564.1 tautomerase family protein [Pseudomonas viridiflava]TKK26686.1 tautomerase family protein [Pseudomonas viridiflava]
MPLLKIDVIKGRSDETLATLLDTVHNAMVEAFQVPVRDRYQIVTEHEPSRMIVQDTGLGLTRTQDVVVITAISRPRSAEMKQTFYKLVAEGLEANCGISPQDLMISMVINSDEDWSFGLGRAQFLTGEL